MDFNPNSEAHSEQIFGLPYKEQEAEIIIHAMPWDATTSSHKGTSKGPEKILEASYQVDLFDENLNNCWQNKLFHKEHELIAQYNQQAHQAILNNQVDQLNNLSTKLNNYLKEQSLLAYKNNQKVICLGGDHSTPFGLLQALDQTYEQFSILHIDAHFDLREAYQDFDHSHASIMFNASKLQACKQIIHLGIRDFCEQEFNYAQTNKKSVTFLNSSIQKQLFEGVSWKTICSTIQQSIQHKNLYISFDIDGLKPYLCPSTGTPVAGGLEFDQVFYLIRYLVDQKHHIIGADLCEVNSPLPNNYDATIGAQALFKLANLIKKSNANA